MSGNSPSISGVQLNLPGNYSAISGKTRNTIVMVEFTYLISRNNGCIGKIIVLYQKYNVDLETILMIYVTNNSNRYHKKNYNSTLPSSLVLAMKT